MLVISAFAGETFTVALFTCTDYLQKLFFPNQFLIKLSLKIGLTFYNLRNLRIFTHIPQSKTL